jgi:prevent-host-death family protein
MRTTTTKKKVAASTSTKASRKTAKASKARKTAPISAKSTTSATSGKSRSTKKTVSSVKAGKATKEQVVSLRELKANPGRYLKRVRTGETFLITDRGAPIAELRPPSTGEQKVSEGLKRMAARGEVTLGSGRPLGKAHPVTPKGGKLASDIIIEEREDRF